MSILLWILVTIAALVFTDCTVTSLCKGYGYAPYTGIIALLLWIVSIALVEGIFFYA